MRALVTGAAGFIGSNLTDRLLAEGHEVRGYDNFCTGQRRFLESALRSPRFSLLEADVLDTAALGRAAEGVDMVFHMAANADVRFGLQHPRKDLEQNTIATSNVLEAMRAAGVRRLAFPSTGSVYGEPRVFPTPEDAPFPVQTSLYAASKLAAEGMISAYAEGYGMTAWIFRFVSILGERYTHGHVFDFYRQLREHPGYLNVLGNGRQRKSYLYVQDCVSAMLTAAAAPAGKVNILNLGQDGYCEVNESVSWITAHLGLQPEIRYAGGERGWVGDSPFIFLDCARMRSLGWTPAVGIREGVIRTVGYLRQNDWVYAARS
jgi:UDP-glucose 4-epimerase